MTNMSTGRLVGALMLLHLALGLIGPYVVLVPMTAPPGGFLEKAAAMEITTRVSVMILIVGALVPVLVAVAAWRIWRARSPALSLWMLALAGVPGIYLHSLLGSRNYTAGVDNTGRPRAINREKLDLKRVESGSRRHEVFERYRHLIRERVSHPAFHPNGAQQVLDLHKAVFAIVRVSPDETQTIVALHNVSPSPVEISIAPQQLGVEAEALTDSLLGERVEHDDSGQWVVFLAPYEVRWLTVEQ